MRTIRRGIIHCSYTTAHHRVYASDIHDWHRFPKDNADGSVTFEGRRYDSRADLPEEVRNARGNGWLMIGYHFVITRTGQRQAGRPLHMIGAHTAGQNADSIGICMVGGKNARGGTECNFNRAQWLELFKLMDELEVKFPGIQWSGHNDWDARQCPTFNVRALFEPTRINPAADQSG